jgi:hypothetical protein
MFRYIKSIWFSWAFITSISAALGFALGAYLMVVFHSDDSPLLVFALLVISGLFIGFGQWGLLRKKLIKTGRWILATTFGLPIGFFLGFMLLAFSPDFYVTDWVATWVISITAGSFTGILQWRALHSKMTGSLPWVLVSALGWAIAINLSGFLFTNSLSGSDIWYLSAPALGILVGAVVGIISGAFVETSIIQTVPDSQIA